MRADRAVLIGQAPSKDGDPNRPLIGPPGHEGLLYKLSGSATRDQFESAFETRNLLSTWPGHSKSKGDLFPMRDARAAAAAMTNNLVGRRVVLLGVGVAKAFGFKQDTPKLTWIERHGIRFALSPHPSLINLWWNNQRNRAEAARFFGSILTGE